MSTPSILRLPSLVSISAALILGSTIHAADGTWTLNGDGSWDTLGNWGGTIADGASFTATFGPIAGIGGTLTTTLDTSRDIGHLSFQGTSGNQHHHVLAGPATLTLTGVSTPTITVNTTSARSVNISATLAGTQGVNLFNTSSSGFTLSGNNTYSGVTAVTGILTISSNSALGATGTGNETTVASASNSALILTNGVTVTGETVTLNGAGSNNFGALQANGTAEWAGNIILGSGSVRIGTENSSSQLTVSGVISGSQQIFFSANGGTVVLAGANTYTGATQIYRGTVKLDGGNDRLPTGTAVTMGGTADASTFNLNGRNQQLARIIDGTNTSNRTITNTSGTASILTLNGTTNASFFATGNTTITGNLSIVKAGTFNQTLAKTNTYTGNTTINAGTVTLASGATMSFFIGANGVNNQILGTGNLALDGVFIFDLTGAAATNGNSWLIADFTNLNESIGGTFAVQNFSKSGSTWSLGNYSFSETSGVLSYSTGVIPEPSTAAALSGLAVLGLSFCRRRRAR